MEGPKAQQHKTEHGKRIYVHTMICWWIFMAKAEYELGLEQWALGKGYLWQTQVDPKDISRS